MAEAKIVLRIFMAVLGDVLEERDALNRIIKELNQKLKPAYGIRLELIQCKTDTIPGFGEESQSLFNGQTLGNYDFFIAIFGNPTNTPNKESLDIIKEEFYRTFELHKANPKSIKIMLLFKEAPIKGNNIDIHLLKKIQEFEWEVEESNFYFPFKTAEKFEYLISHHLGQTILKWADTPRRIILGEQIQPLLESKSDREEVFVAGGILKDRAADGIDKIEVVTFTLNDITRGILNLQNQLSQIFNDKMSKQKSTYVEDARTASRRTTNFLTNYEKIMAAILPIFKESFDDAIEPSVKLIDKKLKFIDEDSKPTLIDLLESIRSFRSEIMESIKKINSFREFVEGFEWNDPDFDNACQNALSWISQLLDHIENRRMQLTEVVKYILKLLQDTNSTADPENEKGKENEASEKPNRDLKLTDKNIGSTIPESNSPINVFISYSRKNKVQLKLLKKQLRPYERNGIIRVLADDNIQPGDHWEDLIERYVDIADVAILMVSANYLESDFIYEKELTPLIEARQNKGLRVIPIIIDYCSFTEVEKLKKLQAINDPNTPLCELDKDKQGKIYYKVVKSIIQ